MKTLSVRFEVWYIEPRLEKYMTDRRINFNFQKHPAAADREPERRSGGDAGAGVRRALGDAEAGSADRRLPGVHRAHHPQGPRGAQGRGERREYGAIYW